MEERKSFVEKYADSNMRKNFFEKFFKEIVIIFLLLILTVTVFVLLNFEFSKNKNKINYSDLDSVFKQVIIERINYTSKENPTTFESSKFNIEHKDEILKTLEIVEKINIRKDLVCVLYRFSVGSAIYRKADYYVKYKDKWYLRDGKFYFLSDYSPEDIYKINNIKRNYQIYKKIDDWTESSKEMLLVP